MLFAFFGVLSLSSVLMSNSRLTQLLDRAEDLARDAMEEAAEARGSAMMAAHQACQALSVLADVRAMSMVGYRAEPGVDEYGHDMDMERAEIRVRLLLARDEEEAARVAATAETEEAKEAARLARKRKMDEAAILARECEGSKGISSRPREGKKKHKLK